MTKGELFLKELTPEAEVTRRYLERVPFNQASFQPHEKSETLGRLAIHLAEIVAWWTAVAEQSDLNFENFEPKNIKTSAELLSYFDELLTKAKQSLTNIRDEEFQNDWSMKHGEEVLFTLPKWQVMRSFCMNHLVHHRAQLGVYLRMLDISVPAAYGPSADDYDVLLINKFE